MISYSPDSSPHLIGLIHPELLYQDGILTAMTGTTQLAQTLHFMDFSPSSGSEPRFL